MSAEGVCHHGVVLAPKEPSPFLKGSTVKFSRHDRSLERLDARMVDSVDLGVVRVAPVREASAKPFAEMLEGK